VERFAALFLGWDEAEEDVADGVGRELQERYSRRSTSPCQDPLHHLVTMFLAHFVPRLDRNASAWYH
jgi:hypothetical protein